MILSARVLRGYLAGLLSALMLAGCFPAPIPPPAGLMPVDTATAQYLVGEFQAHTASHRSLRGLAQVRVAGSGGTRSGTQVLLLDRPGRLRTELLGPFGTQVMLLATDGREFQALLPLDGTFYNGPASAENLATLLRLPLTPDELVDLLLCQVNFPAGPATVFRVTSGGWQIHLQRDGYDEVLAFDTSHRLIGVRRLAGERLQLEVGYGNFAKADGFPRLVTVEIPGQASARLELGDLELDVDIDSSRFSLSPLPNSRRFLLREGVAYPVTIGDEK